MLESIFSALRDTLKDRKAPITSKPNGWRDMFQRNWYLGLTSFGGPAVHFQIVCLRQRSDIRGRTLTFVAIN